MYITVCIYNLSNRRPCGSDRGSQMPSSMPRGSRPREPDARDASGTCRGNRLFVDRFCFCLPLSLSTLASTTSLSPPESQMLPTTSGVLFSSCISLIQGLSWPQPPLANRRRPQADLRHLDSCPVLFPGSQTSPMMSGNFLSLHDSLSTTHLV